MTQVIKVREPICRFIDCETCKKYGYVRPPLGLAIYLQKKLGLPFLPQSIVCPTCDGKRVHGWKNLDLNTVIRFDRDPKFNFTLKGG